MGQHLPVRRLAVHRHAGEQRALEPAAMLVGTFEVHVRRLAQAVLRTLAKHAVVSDAGIEPDVENVADLVVVLRLFAKQFSCVKRIPRVGAFALHALGDLAHQRGRIGMRQAGLAMDEQCDRHAPGALARDRPVRPAIDHAGDARLAPVGEPLDLLDRIQRIGAQVGLAHRDEPLRRGAERHRRLVAPAVRIAVVELEEGEQRTDAAQRLDDDVVRLPDVQAGQRGVTQRRRRRQVHAATVDRVHLRGRVLRDQAVLQADRIVFLAVARRGVDRTRTVLGTDVVAEDERDVALGVETDGRAAGFRARRRARGPAPRVPRCRSASAPSAPGPRPAPAAGDACRRAPGLRPGRIRVPGRCLPPARPAASTAWWSRSAPPLRHPHR